MKINSSITIIKHYGTFCSRTIITKEEREAFRILIDSNTFGEPIHVFAHRFGLTARQLARIIGRIK